jgi:hypothetical protein
LIFGGKNDSRQLVAQGKRSLMKKSKNSIVKEWGAVAILDALGAKNYSEADIEKFLTSRERVLQELNAWVEVPHGAVKLQRSNLITFTFNDTIIIVLRSGHKQLTFDEATSFAAVIRKFIADSMETGLLFRGAAALGSFRVDEQTNTVMGDAVTDAAQWYEMAEWVGVHFTPRSSLQLSSMYEETASNRRWAMFRYDVPLRDGRTVNTYAINWPKILMVPSLSPWKKELAPRAQLLQSLSQHRVPIGTEQKYFNTLTFFDCSFKLEEGAKEASGKGGKRSKK